MHPLLLTQDELHSEASLLLESVLLPLLTQYGQVAVGGSYLYRLLSYPDLDIDVVSDGISKDLFARLCSELITLDCTSKLKSSDRVNYPHTHPGTRPFGYWVAPEINFNGRVWNIDIWLQKPEWYTGDTNKYATELLALNEEQRILILTLKAELIAQKRYGIGKEFSSVNIYEGVLRGGIKTIIELQDFLSN